MNRSLFGMEVEVAVSGVSPDGHPVAGEGVVSALMGHARRNYPCLPARGKGGVFLQNGMLLYIDTGYHPECCTPECNDPAEVVRYLKAAEHILLELGQVVSSNNPAVGEVVFFRGNISYGNGATWGCHESYYHTAEPQTLPRQLLPHFASRIVYTGAGGFLPRVNGIVFTLSPRVAFLTGSVSGSSTESRGVYHTKNEPLCRQGNRLHVLCGESNSSDLSNYLKIGTTALILAAIDHGVVFGHNVALADDLAAMRTFAADPTCGATVPRYDGQPLRAIDIQRFYLSRVEQNLGQNWMPTWAEDVCLRWREVLDLLEQDPRLLAGRIDWAAKHALFDGWLKTVNYDWRRIEIWNSVQARLHAAAVAKGMRRFELNRRTILGPGSVLNTEVQKLGTELAEAGMSWNDIERLNHLRDRLCEIDTRFGQYGPKGIFNEMDAEGLLSHHVPGCEAFPYPIQAVPLSDRANLRCQAIRKLYTNNVRYRCDWLGVYDWTGEILVDLSDPFACTGESSANVLAELDRRLSQKDDRWARTFTGRSWPESDPATPDDLIRLRQRVRELLFNRPAATEPFPQSFQIGDSVRLLVPKPCADRDGHDVKPEEYADDLPGRTGYIAGHAEPDCGGCLSVAIAIDGHYVRWRLRDLERLPREEQALCG